jgi:argininosuccinate lyase
MWDGRFSKPADRLMEAFGNSLPFDQALAEEDIAGSLAWAAALRKAGALSAGDLAKIKRGLNAIAADFRAGRTNFLPQDEDIHMAVERLLTRRIGSAGARLHTGRSRNDQVATDVRLYTKKALARIGKAIAALQNVLLARAGKDAAVIIPAYTHLQQAQPALLAHYWLSLFFGLEREKCRVAHAYKTTDICPLGAGAVAGSAFPVNRKRLAADLGFGMVASNSIDAVASRDFLLETLAAVASTGILLSRYAEDLIIWSSKEFGYVELDDSWASGSSMMPQKKNPDSLELVRGKSGRLLGNYVRLATIMKGVGLAYFKDLQEDKEPLFDSVEQILIILAVMGNVLKTLSVNKERIRRNLDPLLLATDVADYLVHKGLPFRQAHKVVGKIVAHCLEKKCGFADIPLQLLQKFNPLFGKDIARTFSWEHSLSQRNLEGGTGRKSVGRQIELARRLLASS